MRPLFQGRTGCGGRPSGWHDIVTCQHLVVVEVDADSDTEYRMSCISVVVVKILVAYMAYCFDKMKLKRVSCFKSRTPYIHKKINVASCRCFNRSRVSNTSRVRPCLTLNVSKMATDSAIVTMEGE